MEITKFITKMCIVPELDARTKPEVLKDLTHHLYEKKRLKNASAALDQVIAREATESTGIGNGIAVPHARIPGLNNLMCAVGRSTKGIDFMAVDRKPVHVFFLICYPPAHQTIYLNFVATVSRLLSDGEQLQAIIGATDAAGIYEVLERCSKSFVKDQDARLKKIKTDPEIERIPDGETELMLLARLQLQQERLAAVKSGKKRINDSIQGIRAMIQPRILDHFDKLAANRAPALVSVEGDTCQGCFMRLPSQFVQRVRHDSKHVHTCVNCSRYIYVV